MNSTIFSTLGTLGGGLTGSSVSMLLLLAKATLILLVALGITLTMQRASAGARHLVWLVTVAALLLVPALTAWAPIRLRMLPAEASPTLAVAPASPTQLSLSASDGKGSDIAVSAPNTIGGAGLASGS